jgi:steroid delta-isomerase-like uncharacterized protein
MATAATSNTSIVHELIDAINAHDLARMRARWTAETVERFPDATCTGAQEIGDYFQALFDAVPDVRMRIVATAEEGETVFMRWQATGHHTGGPFKGINPTGKAIELDGVDQFTIRDGMIVSNFVIFDQMAFGRQLGLLPPDGSGPDKALKAAFNGLLAAKARLAR